MNRLGTLVSCSILLFAACTFSFPSPLSIDEPSSRAGSQTEVSDTWINLSLVSWQVDTAIDWDADGTDFDPQFRICFNVDAEDDGIPEVCESTQRWEDSLSLTSGFFKSYEVPGVFGNAIIVIECYDNDDESDEENDGPDPCDLNELDEEWKFIININSSSTGTYHFNGSGFGDSNSQGSKGDGNISVMVELAVFDDTDDDGVGDSMDVCPNSPSRAAVDAEGCGPSERDTDGDGVVDGGDTCPNSPSGAAVDAEGCGPSERDTDGDGVVDAQDECPSTPPSSTVSLRGCSPSEVDTDADGLSDAVDDCPRTPSGEMVDASGCARSGDDDVDLDKDRDGVVDSEDECDKTPQGVVVDNEGCVVSSFNTENEDKSPSHFWIWFWIISTVVFLSAKFKAMKEIGQRKGGHAGSHRFVQARTSPSGSNTLPLQPAAQPGQRTVLKSEMEARMLALEHEFQTRQDHSSSQLLALQQELVEMRAMMLQIEEERQAALDQLQAIEAQSENNLTLQDSVVAGDALVGSTKIEQQVVHNDPEAIIRAFRELREMFDEDRT